MLNIAQNMIFFFFIAAVAALIYIGFNPTHIEKTSSESHQQVMDLSIDYQIDAYEIPTRK